MWYEFPERFDPLALLRIGRSQQLVAAGKLEAPIALRRPSSAGGSHSRGLVAAAHTRHTHRPATAAYARRVQSNVNLLRSGR